MGTTVSTLSHFDVFTHETTSVDDFFKQGIRQSAKKISRTSKKANYRNRSGMLRREGTFVVGSSAASPSPPSPQREEDPVDRSRNVRGPNKPPRSSIPTPISRSRRDSTLSNGNVSDVNDNQSEAPSISQVRADTANGNPAKPFYPESWPTTEIIQAHLSKRESEPTTIILARFAPRNSNAFVEIGYSSNIATGEVKFDCSGEMEGLIACREGYEIGETEESQIDHFRLIFKACINSLKGQVWWNGYSMVYDQTSLKRRLKVTAFELGPSQLLFEVANIKEIEIHRTSHRIELRGRPLEPDSEDEPKYFRIRGLNAQDVNVCKLKGNLFTMHIPDYSSECPN